MEIPVLNLSELDSNRDKFISDLKAAFTTFGTCYLINHGIDLELCKDLQRLSIFCSKLRRERRDINAQIVAI